MYNELIKIPKCLEERVLKHRVKANERDNKYYCCDSRNCYYKNVNDDKNYCLAYETRKNGYRRL